MGICCGRGDGSSNVNVLGMEISMEIFYEGDARRRYMRIPDTGESVHHYTMQMLMANRIPGLLRTQMRTIDNETAFYYDITDACSIKEYCRDREADFSVLHALYCQMFDMAKQGEDYLLPDSHYLIRPDTVFLKEIRNGTWRVEAGYHIEQDREFICQLTEFTEYLMEHINHKDKKAVKLIYGLYGMFREEGCTLRRLERFVEECAQSISESPQKHILPQELCVPEEETTGEFARDLERMRENRKWNAAITVVSAAVMAAIVAGVAYYGNLPAKSLVVLAVGAMAAEAFLCGWLLREV